MELPSLELPGPGPQRRSRLPAPPAPPGDVSLWGLLRSSVGKDLSRVALPVQLNEPLNTLQRLCEELEYSTLLDRAARARDPRQRLVGDMGWGMWVGGRRGSWVRDIGWSDVGWGSAGGMWIGADMCGGSSVEGMWGGGTQVVGQIGVNAEGRGFGGRGLGRHEVGGKWVTWMWKGGHRRT